jgi:hypothetical protein
MSLVSTAFGLTLILQAGRYFNTPSYANLLAVAPAWGWGVAYLAVAVLMMLVVVRHRIKVLSIVAHTLSLALILFWLFAFCVRYATDDGTTIVNIISWATYARLLFRSAVLIGDDVAREEVPV